MRALALLAVGAALAAWTAEAAVSAAQPRVAAGSARFDGASGTSRVFRFSATRTSGTKATGWATVEYARGPQLRLTITCMRVIGRRALLAGRVTAATVRAQRGRTAVFAIEDNGEPSRDLLTLVYIAAAGERPYTCANYPAGMVLLKPTKGAVRIGPSKAESA